MYLCFTLRFIQSKVSKIRKSIDFRRSLPFDAFFNGFNVLLNELTVLQRWVVFVITYKTAMVISNDQTPTVFTGGSKTILIIDEFPKITECIFMFMY